MNTLERNVAELNALMDVKLAKRRPFLRNCRGLFQTIECVELIWKDGFLYGLQAASEREHAHTVELLRKFKEIPFPHWNGEAMNKWPLLLIPALALACDGANTVSGPVVRATPVPQSTPTPIYVPPTPVPTPALVYASGRVTTTYYDFTGPHTVGLDGATVRLQGPGFDFTRTATGEGETGGNYTQFPPFPAHLPVTLTCELPGWVTVGKFPEDGYTPAPGIWRNFGCTMGRINP